LRELSKEAVNTFFRSPAELPLQIVWRKVRKRIGRGFFEAREAAAEDKFYIFGRAVALFRDTQLGLFALFRACPGFEEIRSIDEHHNVSVLFDRAGFAQVR